MCKQNDPWKLFLKYLLANLNFAGESYKTRAFYEMILQSTGSVELEHHQMGDSTPDVHGYSKIVIKKLISIDDWVTTSMTEKAMIMKESKISFTY